MEFIISGIHFPISEEMKNYRYYRKLFSDLADQVASECAVHKTKSSFGGYYSKQFQSIRAVHVPSDPDSLKMSC